MVERTPFLPALPDAEVQQLFRAARRRPVTEQELREQRISFAFGNALEDDNITKESVRQAAENLRPSPARERSPDRA